MAKIEKTKEGKFRPISAKKKKVSYGEVENLAKLTKDDSRAETGSPEEQESILSQSETELLSGKSAETTSSSTESAGKQFLEEMLQEYVKELSKEKSKKEGEPTNPEELTPPKSGKPKERDDFLTQYLTTQIMLKALAEVLGAEKVAKEGKEYYSLTVVEGETIQVFKMSPAKKGTILAFNTFPCFDSEEKAQAFLELCHPILNGYCNLMARLDPLPIVKDKSRLEVIH